MSLVNIISAIGNNSSIYPLIVRDCGIEIPAKVGMTYYQNRSDKYIAYLGARERFVDEYAVSAVWLGGVPLIGKIADWAIKKSGFNPEISSKLYKEEEFQGLKYNIAKFKDKAPKEVAELEKALKNADKYRRCLAGKFLAQTIIPVALMGWVIPKMIFKWTAYSKQKHNRQCADRFEKERPLQSNGDITAEKKQSPAFKGVNVGSLAELTNLQKLIMIDGGYAAGRVATARKRNEAYDIAFRMSGMMYLNYLFPKQLEKASNFLTEKALKTNMDLDVKLLANNEFLDSVRQGQFELPKSANPKDLIEFVDNKPEAMFTKYANEFGKVKMLNDKIRDPRAYVDFKALGQFRNSIQNFMVMAKSGATDMELVNSVEKFAKKAKGVKTANILGNVIITSSLLAFGLPKLQFKFREWITGSKLEPGIIN